VEFGIDGVILYGPRGFLSDLDSSYFPLDLMPEDGRIYGPNYVNTYFYSDVQVYNTEVVSDPATAPQKVSDFFDTENFPGKRCTWSWASINIELALLADGVAPEDIYSTITTDEGRQRGFDKLATIKDDIVWVDSGAESVQFILDGQCDLGMTWNGRPGARLKAEPDIPLKVVHEGGLANPGPQIIPEGSPNHDAALSLIAYNLQPRNQCEWLNEQGYGIPMDAPPFPDCLTDFGRANGANLEASAIVVTEEAFRQKATILDVLSEEWAEWITSGQ